MTTSTTPDLDDLCQRYLAAQLAANRREAVRLLLDDGFRRGASVSDLLLDVVQPAQRRIGELWEENRITIADEHVATAISQLAMAQLYEVGARTAEYGVRIAVACVPGELHDMGARVIADILDFDGFDVTFLGADVPIDSLVAFVTRERPAMTALSITMSFHADGLRAAVSALRQAMGPAYPIAAGGHAFSRQLDLESGLDLATSGRDARELATNMRRLLHR